MKKIGLVGFGYWGPNLLRNFYENPDCEVVCVCDKDELRLKDVRRRYPSLRLTENYKELVSDTDINGVVIAVPTRYHYKIASDFISAGKDVLIEKPMTLTLSEARSLFSMAKKFRRIVMVDHTFIYNEAIRKIKEIIDGRVLGDILYIDSTRANLGLFQTDSNVIFDLATHDFSIIEFLLGSPPKSINAFGKAHYNNQEDVADIVCEYPKNVSAYIHVSWLSPLKIRQMLIVGTKKMLVYDDVSPAEKIRIYEKGVDISPRLTVKLEEMKIGYRSGDAWLPNVKGTEALSLVADAFIQSITTRKEPISNIKVGLDVVTAIEKSNESIKTGRTVFLKNANKK